jgi:regulator of replication initiation timing
MKSRVQTPVLQKKKKKKKRPYLKDKLKAKGLGSWVLMAHICNPSYSGGRDQEDQCLKLAWVNSSRDPILKKPHHKKG